MAGLTEAEIRRHPTHGHLITVSGTRKLAAMAPDSQAKLEFSAATGVVSLLPVLRCNSLCQDSFRRSDSPDIANVSGDIESL